MLVGKPRIRIKRSTISGQTPSYIATDNLASYSASTQITDGELFLNTYDQRIWVGVSGGTIELTTASGGTSDYLGLTGGTLTGPLAYEPYGVAGSDFDILVSSGGTLAYTDFVYLDTANYNVRLGADNPSTDFGGASTKSFIAGGEGDNTITNSARAAVIGGQTNIVSLGIDSGIFVGSENFISNTTIASGTGIFAGYQNTITDSTLAAVVGGSGNTINSSNDRSAIIGGLSNVINGAGTDAIIAGGSGNTLNAQGDRSLLLGGRDNSLRDADSLIVGGIGNSIIAKTAAIVGGSGNTINLSDHAFIIGGIGNSIDGEPRSAILGGYQNDIDGTGNSFFDTTIVGGSGHTLISTSNRGAIIGGRDNDIREDDNAVVGGHDNVAIGNNSTIIGGHDNNVATADDVSIIGGSGHTASKDRSVIIGGQNLTTLSADTVYVPYLHINDYADLEPRASAPTAVEGRLYYNSTTNKAQIYDGTVWNNLW